VPESHASPADADVAQQCDAGTMVINFDDDYGRGRRPRRPAIATKRMLSLHYDCGAPGGRPLPWFSGILRKALWLFGVKLMTMGS